MSETRVGGPSFLAAAVLFAVMTSGGLAVPSHAGATAVVPLTLADAVAWALKHSYEVRIARLEAERANNALGETRSSYLPRLSITAYAGYSNRFDEKIRAVDGKGVERKYGLGTIAADEGWFNVYLDQLLFDLSRLRLIERDRLGAKAARLTERWEREDIAYDVTRKYADLVRLEHLAATADTRVRAAEWLNEQARLLLEAGRAVASDREQVALYLEAARLDARARREDVAAGRAALQEALGDGGPGGNLPGVVPESMPPARATETPADAAIRAAPDLQLLALRRQMEEASLASARAGRLPRLRLRAGYSHYGIKRFDNFPDESFVGVGMDLPLFDGFRIENAVAGARRSAEIAELRYRAGLERKRSEVRELLRRLGEAGERSAIAWRQAATAKEQQRLADLRLQAQRGALAEALAAREASARQRREAIGAQFEQVEIWAGLQRKVGRLADVVIGKGPGAAAE